MCQHLDLTLKCWFFLIYHCHIQCHLPWIWTCITFYPVVKRTLCKCTLLFPCSWSSLLIVPCSFPSSSSPLLSSLLSFKFSLVLENTFLSLYFYLFFTGNTFLVFHIVLNHWRFTLFNICYVCFFIFLFTFFCCIFIYLCACCYKASFCFCLVVFNWFHVLLSTCCLNV